MPATNNDLQLSSALTSIQDPEFSAHPTFTSCSMQFLARPIRADEVEQEVTQRDQFNTDAVGLAETLVREALQNSMDGKSRSVRAPVQTRFDITEGKDEDRQFWQAIFEPLRKHLIACDLDVGDLDFGKPRMLVVEDFSTTGLLGAVDRKDTGGFSDFWRRIGRSHKSGPQGGRWGLGKLVFTSASRIRTLFGLTVRETDVERRPYLMGQAVLRHHVISAPNPIDYAPHAFYALAGPGGLQLPETNSAWINKFREATGISRASEPGLSVVVPFIQNDITISGLLPHVIRNWYFPILTGQLEVDLGGQLVDARNFEELAHEHGGPALTKLIAFVKEVHDAASGHAPTQAGGGWHTDGLKTVLPQEHVDKLRSDYAEGKLVSMRLPLTLRPKVGVQRNSYIDLFLRAETEQIVSNALFIRGALTVPGEAKYFRRRGCVAALLATDSAVAAFLGDAEGPAHTTWSGTAEKVQSNWKNASARLREIRDALNMFYDVAADAGDSVNPDALINVFSVQDSGAASTTRRRNPIIRKPVVPDIPRTPKSYRITQRRGGFSIRSTQHTTLPLQIRVAAAYDVMRGDPLKQYAPYDFDFVSSGISIVAEGAGVSKPGLNELLIEVQAGEFSVSVEGFDVNRDLFIKAERHGQ